MKKILFLLIAVLIISCNELKKETPIVKEKTDSVIQKIEPVIEQEPAPSIIYQDTTSHLNRYKVKLENSKYLFSITEMQQIEFDRINLLSTNQRFHLERERKLKNEILKICEDVLLISSFKFKGQVTISSNTYPRGSMTEYIYPNKEMAKKSFDKLMNFKQKHRSYWEMKVDVKCPSKMILKDNRIYHIITGGWFMMGMEHEIATIMFE